MSHVIKLRPKIYAVWSPADRRSAGQLRRLSSAKLRSDTSRSSNCSGILPNDSNLITHAYGHTLDIPLFPWQILDHTHVKTGCLLALGMGLGKTATILTMLRYTTMDNSRMLFVTTNNLVSQLLNEIVQWWPAIMPTVQVLISDNACPTVEPALRGPNAATKTCRFFITTYSFMVSRWSTLAWIFEPSVSMTHTSTELKLTLDAIVFDESALMTNAKDLNQSQFHSVFAEASNSLTPWTSAEQRVHCAASGGRAHIRSPSSAGVAMQLRSRSVSDECVPFLLMSFEV
jgi:hypothetical protein